jgi:hypothetical protein
MIQNQQTKGFSVMRSLVREGRSGKRGSRCVGAGARTFSADFRGEALGGRTRKVSSRLISRRAFDSQRRITRSSVGCSAAERKRANKDSGPVGAASPCLGSRRPPRSRLFGDGRGNAVCASIAPPIRRAVLARSDPLRGGDAKPQGLQDQAFGCCKGGGS